MAKLRTLTFKEVSEATGFPKKLLRAVVNQMGYRVLEPECIQTLTDVGRFGADAGWCGFIYYSDTLSFFRKYRRDIMGYFTERSEDFCDSSVIATIANFSYCRKNDISLTDVTNWALRTSTDYKDTLDNLMSWATLEEAAHYVEMYCEDKGIRIYD